MSQYISFNNQFLESSTPLVPAASRALRYGDGIFETMRCLNGQIQWMDAHFERLFKGLELFSFTVAPHFTAQWLAERIKTLCNKNEHTHARVRINMIRGNGGLYDAVSHTPHCIIETWQLPRADFELNQNGLVTGIYPHARKPVDIFSNCKHNNYLPYTMAALCARQEKWNDAIVLNTAGNVCDASIANVFMVKDGSLYTCPLTEGCVAGIFRRNLLENEAALGLPIIQKIITPADLLGADEVFLTNAVQGMRWVSHCGNATYDNQVTSSIFQKLLKK